LRLAINGLEPGNPIEFSPALCYNGAMIKGTGAVSITYNGTDITQFVNLDELDQAVRELEAPYPHLTFVVTLGDVRRHRAPWKGQRSTTCPYAKN